MNWIGLLFLFLAAFLAGTEEVSWQIQEREFTIRLLLSSSEVALNDVVHLQALFSYPDSYQLETEGLLEHLLWHVNPLQPQWKVIRQNIDAPRIKEGIKEQSAIFLLQPLIVGTLDLSLLNVVFIPLHSYAKQSISLETTIFFIKVNPSLGFAINSLETAPLIPLVPQFPIDLTGVNRQKLLSPQELIAEERRNQQILAQRNFPWLGFVFILFLGMSGLILLKLWQAYQKKRQAQFIPAQAQKKALQALKVLKQQDFPYQGMYKEFYTQLTDIIRYYLEERFRLPTTSQTTEEFLQRVSHFSLFQEQFKEQLSELLQEADQVKFAHYVPRLEDCEKAYQVVRKIIRLFD